MSKLLLQRLTGSLLILGAVLINIPYALLIVNFGYPDILREPTGDILAKFNARGASLILTWLAFAWVGLPLFFAIIYCRVCWTVTIPPICGLGRWQARLGR